MTANPAYPYGQCPTCGHGVNNEGYCQNEECSDFDEQVVEVPLACPECGGKEFHAVINVATRTHVTIGDDDEPTVTLYEVTNEPDGSWMVVCTNDECDYATEGGWMGEGGDEVYEVVRDAANEWSNWGFPTFTTTEQRTEAEES